MESETMSGLRIGVDVGGTNTDAVLMRGSEVIAATKQATTADVASGIRAALGALPLTHHQDEIRLLTIGTTQFTNAIVERRHLAPVAALRLVAPAGRGLTPRIDWPEDLSRVTDGGGAVFGGGHLYDGRVLSPLDWPAMTAFVENSLAAGVQNFAISAAFSPVFEGIEQQVADLILQRNPEAGITCSHELGGLGLVERENAAILNAALLPLAKQVTEAFADAAASLDLGCPVFISQNDGTLMSLERARRFPALTFASGPTNSIRGAAHLTGLEDALVVDIGGTTSDIGVLHQGFPRLANHVVMLGGVRTNFRMPDINAIGIGGGSVVSDDGSEIGPASVGHQLLQRALVAGGDTLTATDIAVAAGQSIFGDPALVSELPRALVDRVQSNISERLSRAVEAMKPGAQRLPVVLVGGGAVLVTADKMAGGDVLRPLHAGVANAIGASIAEVSGEAQAFLTDASQTRESLLADLEQQATAQAITAGGDPSTVRVLEREQSAIPYMEQGNLKLRVKVVASLALLTGADA